MELTPETVQRAEFGRSWGGYDMREVDAFLAEISTGVDGLHARIREVTLRAERAEARGGGGLDDTIKRTLTLAQRAADLVVREAKGVAERTAAEATAKAERIVAEAHAEVERITARAREEADRIVAERLESAQHEHRSLSAQLAAERSVIEEQHRRKRDEAAAMDEHAHETRDRLRAALADHLTRLDLLEFGEPPVVAPDVAVADVVVPDVAVPDVVMPEVAVPEVAVPAVSAVSVGTGSAVAVPQHAAADVAERVAAHEVAYPALDESAFVASASADRNHLPVERSSIDLVSADAGAAESAQA